MLTEYSKTWFMQTLNHTDTPFMRTLLSGTGGFDYVKDPHHAATLLMRDTDTDFRNKPS